MKTATERMKDDARKAIKARIRYERKFERELEKDFKRYRAATPQMFKSAGRNDRPRTILAEGDSWARYGIGFAVPWHLPKLDSRNHVMNVASPGDTASEMLTGSNARRLGRRIRSGPARRRKFDVIYFSGGGNDLLGDGRFATFLRPYEAGMSAADVVNRTTLNAAFKCLQIHYTTLVRLRDDNSPETKIYFNAYDFARPTGKRACGFIGPWLRPHLEASGAPEALFPDIVNYFLERYAALLTRFVNSAGTDLVVLDTQGTLTPRQWENEIHPTKGGFRQIARVVQEQLAADFP
ncbi:MAG: hypothetical protein AAF662_03435 [Pseudomonadota bacterium]